MLSTPYWLQPPTCILYVLSGRSRYTRNKVQGVDLVSLTRICQNVYTIFSFRHNDLAWNIRQFIHNKLKTVNFSSDLTQVSPWGTSKWSHTDIPRLVRGKIGAQVGIRNGAVQISNYQVTSTFKSPTQV